MAKWIFAIAVVIALAAVGVAAFLRYTKNAPPQAVLKLITPAPVPLPPIAVNKIVSLPVIPSPPAGDEGTRTTTTMPLAELKVTERCENAEDQFDCWEEHYTITTRTNGVKAAVADLKERYEASDYAQAQCHPLMHVIGNAAVRTTTKIADAFKIGDPFCWSGYYHGVMEGVAGRIGRTKLASQMDSICAGIPGKSSYRFDYYNCVHGMGHGVMAILNDELFDSLTLCNKLTGAWEQSSCWSGVFMENIIVDNKNHFTKYLKPEDPLYPCNAVADKYKATCYLMQTSYMLKVTGEDFPQVFKLCEGAGTPELVNTCYQSLGRDASGHTVSDIARTKAYCLMGPDMRAETNCVVGAVKDFISYYHSDVQAQALCAALTPAFHDLCYGTVKEYYQSF